MGFFDHTGERSLTSARIASPVPITRADTRSSRTIRSILRDLTVPGLQPAENRVRASSGVSMRPTLCSASAVRGCASSDFISSPIRSRTTVHSKATGGRTSSIYPFRINTRRVHRFRVAPHLMVKILNGKRPPEAAAGDAEGSLMSGWLMRPPKHDGQRVVPTGWTAKKGTSY
jgi:hypothetical protein